LWLRHLRCMSAWHVSAGLLDLSMASAIPMHYALAKVSSLAVFTDGGPAS